VSAESTLSAAGAAASSRKRGTWIMGWNLQ
jgi:hypothetical protein